MIEQYVQDILTPWLRSKSLPAQAVPLVAADVSDRLHSTLRHWGVADYRAALLMPTREEAIFYEPRTVPLDVRSLVVLCVRDSLVEDWCSEGSGRDAPLTDTDVRELTTIAITYFSGQSIKALARLALPDKNVFGDLPAKYPAAWQALSMLAALTPSVAGLQFKPVAPQRPKMPLPIEYSGSIGPAQSWVTLSGMSPRIDPHLAGILRQLEQNRLDIFFSHNFKMITRNLDKLLSIVEFVLACGKSLVTINYYLSNGLVQQRNRLWRPAHTRRESEFQTLDQRVLQDVAPQHEAALRGIRDQFFAEISAQH